MSIEPPKRHKNPNRRVIHVHCSTHGGSRGFTNLVVSRREGSIELDPHVTGQCLLVLDETAATELSDAISELLG